MEEMHHGKIGKEAPAVGGCAGGRRRTERDSRTVDRAAPRTGTRIISAPHSSAQYETAGDARAVDRLWSQESSRFCHSATVYNAIAIHGITVVEGKAQTLQVRMPRAPRGAQTRHSDIAYPINKTARQTLYGAVLQEYERLYAAAEAERQKTKLQIPD